VAEILNELVKALNAIGTRAAIWSRDAKEPPFDLLHVGERRQRFR